MISRAVCRLHRYFGIRTYWRSLSHQCDLKKVGLTPDYQHYLLCRRNFSGKENSLSFYSIQLWYLNWEFQVSHNDNKGGVSLIVLCWIQAFFFKMVQEQIVSVTFLSTLNSEPKGHCLQEASAVIYINEQGSG